MVLQEVLFTDSTWERIKNGFVNCNDIAVMFGVSLLDPEYKAGAFDTIDPTLCWTTGSKLLRGHIGDNFYVGQPLTKMWS